MRGSTNGLPTPTGRSRDWIGLIATGVYGTVVMTPLTNRSALLQFAMTVDSAIGGSILDSDRLPYTAWESAVGISIDKNTKTIGTWSLHENYSPFSLRIDKMGYGASCDVQPDGIRFGRAYNTTGSWGSWSLRNLEGYLKAEIVVRLAEGGGRKLRSILSKWRGCA